MNVKSSGTSIQYRKVNGYLARLEGDDDCGSGAIIWGFIAAVLVPLLVVIFMCFGRTP